MSRLRAPPHVRFAAEGVADLVGGGLTCRRRSLGDCEGGWRVASSRGWRRFRR